MNYYNEIDEYAARWLGNLMIAGHLPLGVIDTRSIEDVTPNDLRGFTQCHFFAGIGVWSYALRRAGWPDDRPVWTGSCPCQPFSAAGAGAGFADERHLWPTWQWLIEQCRPAVVLGEQVAGRGADVWVDLVHADLEALGYAFGCVPFPSASVGAPHIRDRAYWVADASGARQLSGAQRGIHRSEESAGPRHGQPERHGSTGRLGHADVVGTGRDGRAVSGQVAGQDGQHIPEHADAPGAGVAAGSGPVNGLWRAAEWLLCRDGKWRPVEPGTFPLAHGAPARVGRLRAYGNAINAEAAEAWIRVVMDCMPET